MSIQAINTALLTSCITVISGCGEKATNEKELWLNEKVLSHLSDIKSEIISFFGGEEISDADIQVKNSELDLKTDAQLETLAQGIKDTAGEHYTELKDKLSGDVKNLASIEDLLKGPPDLVPLVSNDKEQQRAALGALQTLDKYGEQLLPYLGYVISDLDNWLSISAFNYLFHKAQHLALKSNRGMYSSVDNEKSKEVLKATLHGQEINLESYPPLKPILLHVLSNSSRDRSRTMAAKILVDAYDGSKELENALISQMGKEVVGDTRDELFAALTRLSVSEEYKNGFLSDATMKVVIDEFGRDGAVRTIQPAAYLVGRYKPTAALPMLKLIIKEKETDDIKFYYVLTVLQEFRGKAVDFVPLLQEILDEEKGGKYSDDIKNTLAIISRNEVNR